MLKYKKDGCFVWLFSVFLFLNDRQMALQDLVFKILFEAAEIAKFTPDEKNKKEKRLK